jgi:hypothetical protein
MPVSHEAPLRLPKETKEKVILLAGIMAMKQGELVSKAVEEYLVNHQEEIQAGISRAKKILSLESN